MNAETGRLYEAVGTDVLAAAEVKSLLSEVRDFGHPDDGDLRTALVAARHLDRQPTADEAALLADAARGETIVPVSDAVAQQMKLGRRELDRRAKRRAAAKQARKRNR